MNKLTPLIVSLGLVAGTAQAEIHKKVKVIAEYQSYSIEADGSENVGAYPMFGAGITLYNQSGVYLDAEFMTGSPRTEVSVALGKSFGSYALFAGYKDTSTTTEVPQYNNNEFDLTVSGFFFGGSKNFNLEKGTFTLSSALGLGMDFSQEGDHYDDSIVESVSGGGTSTWSFSGAYNKRMGDGEVMSLGMKYAEYDLGGSDTNAFENVDASAIDEQILSLYIKYAL